MIGEIVIHRIYGRGKVVGIDDNHIIIMFSSAEKTFAYPDSFKQILVAEDSKIQTHIISELVSKEKKKLREQHITDGEIVPKKQIERFEAETKEFQKLIACRIAAEKCNKEKFCKQTETETEAAKRRYKERIEAEKQEIESLAADRLALKINAIAREDRERIAAKKRFARSTALDKITGDSIAREREEALRLLYKKWAREEIVAEQIAEEKKAAERKSAEKWARVREEKERKLAGKRAIEKEDKERIAAEKKYAERIEIERKEEKKREAEKKYAIFLFERKKSQIEIRISQEKEIREFLSIREIKYLFHFTRIENLNSILQNGLVPVNLQSNFKISSIHNDEQRYDSQLDCTSFSVGFPNYKLFYTFRKKFPEAKWALIVIDANVLLSTENTVYFCHTNAAHIFHKATHIEALFGFHAFENMFCDSITTKENKTIYRESLNIRDNYSTDPQAEILISDIIPPNYIKHICFPNHEERKAFDNNYGSDLLNTFNPRYNRKLFEFRDDWKFWQKEKQNDETDLLYL